MVCEILKLLDMLIAPSGKAKELRKLLGTVAAHGRFSLVFQDNYNTLPDPSSDIPLIKLLRKDLIVRVELFLQFDRLQELLLNSSLGFLSKKRVKSGASVG